MGDSCHRSQGDLEYNNSFSKRFRTRNPHNPFGELCVTRPDGTKTGCCTLIELGVNRRY